MLLTEEARLSLFYQVNHCYLHFYDPFKYAVNHAAHMPGIVRP
ncbi:hypothetical protein PAMC26577_23495 [Caballeronia sordidicola]|uniref:Uncharacterized protein n=1 Tax=Caballeronia sordidicola TaxID=196367 RepID=A0A242MJD1_CABSO|nr:hypothetical protein PAMC26577_23495 [Caballeronia sordidicola]